MITLLVKTATFVHAIFIVLSLEDRSEDGPMRPKLVTPVFNFIKIDVVLIK